MNSKNIVLIGMPGVGKSTIGWILAKALKVPFVDTDLLIGLKEKRGLQEIINAEGIGKFLTIEARTILELTYTGSVIATGGSAVLDEAAMNHLKSISKLVYLKLACSDLETRIKNISSRGIAMESTERLIDVYSHRTPLYEKYANYIVDCADKPPEVIVSEIIKRILDSGVILTPSES